MDDLHQAIERSRRTAEDHIHVEMIPGTELMADVAGVHLTHASNSPQGVVLVPQPSSDPTDPLNWKTYWKYLAFFALGIFTFLSCFPILAAGPLYPILVEEWNVTMTAVSVLTGITAATYGSTNFILIPCADIFGRRPILLICATILLVSNVWMAVSTSYQSAIGARVLAGIGSSANESIMALVVADMFFLHERGTYMGVYFYAYVSGNVAGPIISGAFGQHVTWRWFYHFCAIITGFCLLLMILFTPETRRIEAEYAIHNITTPQDSQVEAAEKPANIEHYEVPEKALEPSQSLTVTDEFLNRGHPSLAQFMPFQKIYAVGWKDIGLRFLMPFYIFLFPIALWATVLANFAISCMLACALTQSQALSIPPYNWDAQSVGFSNFAILVGCVIGIAVAGPFSDWVAMKATIRNNGVREPEMRLMAMIPFIALAVIGNLIVGVGFDNQWPWQAPIVLGYTFIGIVAVALQTIPITYAIDCYKPQAGAILAQATVSKNFYGLGMTFFVNDWVASKGFLPLFATEMALTVGFALGGLIIFSIWGKALRRYTKDSFVHKM